MADTYDVGYGKPPKHTRFRKGHSGNPRGRPKGSLDVKTELSRLLATKTKIKINDSVERVPTTRVLCLALIKKAMGGDVRAFSKIVEMIGPEMADELKATASVFRLGKLSLWSRIAFDCSFHLRTRFRTPYQGSI